MSAAAREASLVWSNRAMREQEAAQRFCRLAAQLRAHGAPEAIALEADAASADEARHETRCAWLSAQLGAPVPYGPITEASVAPPTVSAREALLYDVVASCCIAETINTALLLTELELAEDGRVRDVTRELLSDEVRHGKLGWRWFAHEAAAGKTAGVVNRLPRMLRLALGAEHPPFVAASEQAEQGERNALGMLSPQQRRQVLRACVFDVVLPGFAAQGADMRPLARAAEDVLRG